MSTPPSNPPTDPPERADAHGASSEIPAAAFVEVAQSPEFEELQRRFRNFAFPMTAAFLVWYFAYVLMSVYAKDFMTQSFLGMQYFNVGHFLGLLQFVTTFLITWLYLRQAKTRLDPLATQIREKLEGDAR
ncbi:DUF485 domain-containing protein [Propioniciclava coleopterorum]|uniref:DUF485 domain-containing protein n=1 Tax=Propioniciclava coleopterorum TaxID=2714937 RepID=A0A6G7Y8L8_9ACTN|nr:DUF485 domain-containing protein [Propioniciclava coleopterorum]QIK73059.1 DUF485 domain-containing protein [Propioniciclava coleopterorum]